MKHGSVFGKANYVGSGDDSLCPFILDSFTYGGEERVEITIIGFSFFKLFINGKPVQEEYFLPLYSDYEPRDFPKGEILGHRAYPEKIDITKFLKDGRNTLAVLLGNGWYNGSGHQKAYGVKKVCFRIDFISGGKVVREVFSDDEAKWCDSFLYKSDNHTSIKWGEEQDYRNFDFNILSDSESWENLPNVVIEKNLDTEYYFSDCPRDKKIKTLIPTLVKDGGVYKVYDLGINTTGIPVIKGAGEANCLFSESLRDNDIDEKYIHGQYFIVRFGNGTDTASPYFTWLACRYVKVVGNAELVRFDVVHSDVKVTSDFKCDDDTLNWLYKAFLNTLLTNYHTGVPSDCPQFERRGYTGDGQLACRAAMYMTDSEKFYRKWIADISDCQDEITGRVQYTAPYTRSGGASGGFSSAIIKVPYQFWKFYGDDGPMRALYPKMLKYLDYMESLSVGGLVVVNPLDVLFIGDWCGPDTGIVKSPGGLLPTAFVNTYFYIKSLKRVSEIAEYLGFSGDAEKMTEKAKRKGDIFTAAYFNHVAGMYFGTAGSFFGGEQGADAFAFDLGLDIDGLIEKVIKRYSDLGYFDTGIFGTEVLTRLLFESGNGEIAYRLMTAKEPHGISEWRERGLTTIPEYWREGRSLNHPMKGALTVCLFEYILGIRQREGTAGFEDIIISPCRISELNNAEGYITTVKGKIAVKYVRTADKTVYTVTVPSDVKAELWEGDKVFTLKAGENVIVI
ncbi:MAG: alpha-L-rhamnosidase N-terminal domain-containing protein [Clostridia bacterium]|nr:alpha-L-rhamnosidase N-terminal domain-containing protein [Clostridia bacterium]